MLKKIPAFVDRWVKRLLEIMLDQQQVTTECQDDYIAAIGEQRQKSHTHLTTAVATVQHTRDWLLGTKPGDWTSMIVISDGSYGIEKGLPYSFPIQVTKPGEWEIVQGLDLNYYESEKLAVIMDLDWFLYIASPDQDDLRLSGPPLGQGTGGRLEPTTEGSLQARGDYATDDPEFISR
ncbi:malate dehydrogenase [Plakobranchus ocellatus]|uniref:Malate dehydrogenase n=1 Tax=Plakobranchus ocellatus TaxID=259542 RepID=A0AAV4E1U8_9GAST|nr:malate dehydrogenase [Plakobranchus ocellatus]